MPTMEESLGNLFRWGKFMEGVLAISLIRKIKALYRICNKSRRLMPFGLKTACATFVRLIRRVLAGYPCFMLLR